MSKGHQDNHKARLKRGSVAFKKKAERRASKIKCIRCGGTFRIMTPEGLCYDCRDKSPWLK